MRKLPVGDRLALRQKAGRDFMVTMAGILASRAVVLNFPNAMTL